MSFCIEDLKEAYIKLKSNVYHDSTSLFLRKNIAEFERNIEDNLNELLNELNNTEDNDSFKNICDKLTKSIGVKYLPKKIDMNENPANVIGNYKYPKRLDVSKLMLTIDLPIKYHIIGVLWVLRVGYKIDKKFSNSVYANRLKSKNKLNRKIDLFEKYYNQYNSWRDNALKEMEHLMDNGRKSLVLCLDIKDYYYSVNIKLDSLEEYIESIDADFKTNRDNIVLSSYIECILRGYSKLINKKDDKVVLPIGFLPSHIIANWYLKEFDKNILEKLSPSYYGRYVDDILIVLPNYDSRNYTGLDEIINKHLVQGKNILEGLYKSKPTKELIFESLDEDLYISIKNILINNEDMIKKNEKIIDKLFNENIIIELYNNKLDFLFQLYNGIKKEKIKDFENRVKELDRFKNYFESYKITGTDLIIQSNKMKVYTLDPKGYKAIIENFKKNIQKNSSEFRYLPLEEDVIKNFNEEVYELTYSDTINKIRSVEDVKINKFEVSKYLAKILFIHKFNLQSDDNDISNQIITLFQNKYSIEFYTLWEKVFTYFILKDKKHELNLFVNNILHYINKLKLNLDSNVIYFKCANEQAVKQDVIEYMIISLCMPLSFNMKRREYILDIIEKSIWKEKYNLNYNPVDLIRKTSSDFRYANLFRHNYIHYPLINYTNVAIDSKKKIDLLDYNYNCDTIGMSDNKKCQNCSKCTFKLNDRLVEYSPRFVHLYECILYDINRKIGQSRIVGFDKVNKKNKISKLSSYRFRKKNSQPEESYKTFKKFNFGAKISNNFSNEMFNISQTSNLNNQVEINKITISVDENSKDKLRIGIANIQVEDNDIKASYLKVPNINTDRLKKIFTVINNAEKENVDILVFPEVSIPYMLLPTLAYEAMKKDMVIVCGLEHLVLENEEACNYIATILPINNKDKYSSSYVKLRLKNHYSPEETKILKGYGWKIPKNEVKYYDLFEWKGVSFSCYNCFELANINDRAIFRSKVDLLIASVFNKDTNYFSNIVESITRDIHCYFIQVNSSNYGDSRITKPASRNERDILRIKGGENSTILVADIDIIKLRDFQIKDYVLQKESNVFKPTPPEFEVRNVKNRMNLP